MIWFRQRHIRNFFLWLLSCYSEFYLSHNSWHKATTEVTTLELGCFLCTFLLVQCTKSQREENDRVHPKCARCIDPSCTVVWLPLSSLSLWRQRTTRGGKDFHEMYLCSQIVITVNLPLWTRLSKWTEQNSTSRKHFPHIPIKDYIPLSPHGNCGSIVLS